MFTALIVGVALTVIGLGGSVSACMAPAADRDMVVASLSGVALAVGLCLIALGAASRGYHRRDLGDPPRDMDPHPQDSPPADRPDL